jgi:hypothetical protein
MSTATSAAELAKLVGKANDAAAAAAAGEDAAAQERCLDILRALLKAQVTAKLLKDTDAGKRVNRLAKSADKDIAEAAGKVVAAWRSSVRKQAEAAGGPAPSASLPGVSSAPSLGALTAGADSGSEQQEAASAQTVQPPQSSQSQQQQQQQQQHQLSQHQQSQQQQQQQQQQQPPPPGSKQPPRTGDPKRDKVAVLASVCACCSVFVRACWCAHCQRPTRTLLLPACTHAHTQIRGLMLVGLAMVPPAAYSEQGYDPANVAAEVETAIFHKYGDTGADYSAKVRVCVCVRVRVCVACVCGLRACLGCDTDAAWCTGRAAADAVVAVLCCALGTPVTRRCAASTPT